MKFNERFHQIKSNARTLDVFSISVNLIEAGKDITFLFVWNSYTCVNNLEKECYVATSLEVSFWFNVNAETPYPDTKHNQVNTREELKRYDPGLYALIAKYFPETNAQIGKHKKENLYQIK